MLTWHKSIWTRDGQWAVRTDAMGRFAARYDLPGVRNCLDYVRRHRSEYVSEAAFREVEAGWLTAVRLFEGE